MEIRPKLLTLLDKKSWQNDSDTDKFIPTAFGDSENFDDGIIVTTICFVDDPKRTLNEALRVLKPRAIVVIGFVDRVGGLGKQYQAHQAESVFYRAANFYTAS